MKFYKLLLAITLVSTLATGCRKYLDINSDPANPQQADLAALLPPVTAVMSRTMAFDGRER
jgi:hypothetical protein